MKNTRLALGFLSLLLVAMPAFAATATASFSVTATVQATCEVSAPATASKAYTAATTANAASNVSVTCTNPTPYNVSLGAGGTADAGRKEADSASARQISALTASPASGAQADSVTVTITY
jgi:spore coat protein U-like protein